MNPPGQLIDIGGRRLHVVAAGEGAPAVVLESGGGGGASVQDWPVLRRVARFARCLAYDRAGLGWSDPPTAPRSFEAMADDLAALLAAVGEPGPIVLVGGSFGGLLARAFAQRFPATVAGMVLVDAAEEAKYFATMAAMRPLHEAELREAARRAASGALAREAEPAIRAAGRDEATQAAMLWVLRRPEHFTASLDELAAIGLATSAQRAAGGFGGLGDKPLVVLSHGRPYAGEMAVWENGWAEAQARLAALSTHSAHVVAETNGHSIALENPVLVAAAIRAVARAVRGAPLDLSDVRRRARAP
ncbi:MAG TPA: alpha/beta fold hydrolase [Phenylobacterium sp.]|uniref:alpha/beta fold hydrolase n=1 Tax=Phenylobacterium sp. TaxID=1871053 RepID=UPI002BEA7F3A|nr:alpha/beta fold hydrolase [Phenylobacterium sp.]HSV02854.1 alpha/beta fold hydrolase [Phenylobacterium sp.]